LITIDLSLAKARFGLKLNHKLLILLAYLPVSALYNILIIIFILNINNVENILSFLNLIVKSNPISLHLGVKQDRIGSGCETRPNIFGWGLAAESDLISSGLDLQQDLIYLN